MNKSQFKATAGAVVVGASLICEKLGAFTSILPPTIAKWLPVVSAVSGALVILYNQSLSSDHVSVPVEKVAQLTPAVQEKLGLADKV
jgi:hypothetical protein